MLSDSLQSVTEDEFVALWGNGSAVKEQRTIDFKRGGTQERRADLRRRKKRETDKGGGG